MNNSNQIFKLLNESVTKLPHALRAKVEQTYTEFSQSIKKLDRFDLPKNIASELPKVWACSDYFSAQSLQNLSLFIELIQNGDLQKKFLITNYQKMLSRLLHSVKQRSLLVSTLRQFRHQQMLRIIWRDLTGLADLQETMKDMSDLADTCVQLSLDVLHNWQCITRGTPVNTQAQPIRLNVLAMGKLGGQELNLSSDIDLIFVYSEDGNTQDGQQQITNYEFFTQLGQSLIKVLHEPTQDGFVFRTDLRLRPFGTSGPLVMSIDGLERYYQQHGREWERYALVKTRVITGDPAIGRQLMSKLKPFVYRRYIDFGMLDSLRKMKMLIIEEVKRKKQTDNIKLGIGGIREIEFIVQVFQLIRGGNVLKLQEQNLLIVLQHLSTLKYLPANVVNELKRAYCFLRMTENKLQAVADQQTHKLPSDSLGKIRLAYAMGFDNWENYHTRLNSHLRNVHTHFTQVFDHSDKGPKDHSNIDTNIWIMPIDEEHRIATIEHLGFTEPKNINTLLIQLKQSYQYRNLSIRGRERMDQLVPLLINQFPDREKNTQNLQNLLKVITAIAQRTAYLALLIENPMALAQLVKLCSASSWVTDLLAQHPVLLDDLIDPRTLYSPPDSSALNKELKLQIQNLPDSDLDQHMELLRKFKQANVLRVAAADVADQLKLMVVSDHLTWIAEAILNKVLTIAFNNMVERHGHPECEDDKDKCFAIVAYGKLGGIELGYGSDLDLVFLHRGLQGKSTINGQKPINNSLFFTRLGQRIIHILTAYTPAGVLYDVDMRLRPSGSSGILVSNIDAFQQYQKEHAWSWEHQALVRARFVAGHAELAVQFNHVRHSTLCLPRNSNELRKEVRSMRNRMLKTLENKHNYLFDLKKDKGGITDIEFIVQYGVLAWAHECNDLAEYTDNIRILKNFAAFGFMSDKDVNSLIDAYCTYRAKVHRLNLQQRPAVVDIKSESKFADYRNKVRTIWNKIIDSAP